MEIFQRNQTPTKLKDFVTPTINPSKSNNSESNVEANLASYVDTTNNKFVYQHHPHVSKWTQSISPNPSFFDSEVGFKSQRATQNVCFYVNFLSSIEPASVKDALSDHDWTLAMQEEINQFDRLKVWRLVLLPKGKSIVGTKWIFNNKKDENDIVI